MAASLPAMLKIKEITPFVTRAAQLEKYKPIVAYWCMYKTLSRVRLYLYRQATTTLSIRFWPRIYIRQTKNA